MFDVVVIGEPLLEFASLDPLDEAGQFQLSFSGDALNAAVAAVAAGARTALLTRIGDDQLGDRLVAFAAERGVDTSLIRRDTAPTGAYIKGADASFVYLRAGSAASRLDASDVEIPAVATAGALLCSGITAAISDSAREAVLRAARWARGAVVYDPNFRARLTTAQAARQMLAAVAAHVTVMVPSAPQESEILFGSGDPVLAARSCRALGAASAVVTCGEAGTLVSTADGERTLAAAPAPKFVDSVGAGDSFAGTLSARLALGDALEDAVRWGMAAASLSLGGLGGTGHVATLQQIRHHMAESF